MTDHILGVDISKANLDVHLMPTGETQQFANSTVGFRRLIAWLRERPVSRVVYEPTGPWHRDFERALGKAGLSLSGQSVAGAALCAGTGPKGQDGRHRRPDLGGNGPGAGPASLKAILAVAD